jgi:tetratricopeptide (TPR) repeat protein
MRVVVVLVLTLLVSASRPAAAEVQQLWESPAAGVSQHLGLTEIKIDYHRPAVKGRAIWGQLVPYGKVWRTGANDATTISFSTAVRVAGKEVPAGTYALFAVPDPDRFTFILNKTSRQWGAYFYKAEEDQLRFAVKPEPAAHKEWLEYQLDLKDRTTAIAALHWEKLRVSFPIEAEVDRIYREHLSAELAKADQAPTSKDSWSTYFLAAKYWINQGGDLGQAGALLDKAGRIDKNFWYYEWRARLLQKQGKVKEALPLLSQAKQLAAGKAPQGYLDGLDALRAEWLSRPAPGAAAR